MLNGREAYHWPGQRISASDPPALATHAWTQDWLFYVIAAVAGLWPTTGSERAGATLGIANFTFAVVLASVVDGIALPLTWAAADSIPRTNQHLFRS
jgi:hypothetical protein